MTRNTVFRNRYIGKSDFHKNTEPVVGYKRASLMMEHGTSPLAKVFIKPLHGPEELEKVGFNDESQCPLFLKKHMGKPNRICGCGFYAYSDMQDAVDHNENLVSPILKTVASGKMLMYAKGVRSGHQRVEEVIFRHCFDGACMRYADRVALRNFSTLGFDILGCCKEHGRDRNTRPFSWVEWKINATLTNNEPRVKVRSLDDSLVPWNGATNSLTRPKEDIESVWSTLKRNALFASAMTVGFIGSLAYVINFASSLFN